jgi:hypothetical protein
LLTQGREGLHTKMFAGALKYLVSAGFIERAGLKAGLNVF